MLAYVLEQASLTNGLGTFHGLEYLLPVSSFRVTGIMSCVKVKGGVEVFHVL